jgi:SAM-dependent methyltransferase
MSASGKYYDLDHNQLTRLNLGCGHNPIAGYVNLDRADLPGVDVVHDLESFPLPFADDTIDEIIGVDLIEHITDALGLMQELWRIAKPDAVCSFALPYGSSDDAWEDPTHVRPYFINSWAYFSQPYYYRADYGYRGDWQPETLQLDVTVTGTVEDLHLQVMALRNVVQRQIVTLRAIKPARECLQSLIVPPRVGFKQVR